ncbi:hypothetical protein CapIbe_013293 [Capra ibex]
MMLPRLREDEDHCPCSLGNLSSCSAHRNWSPPSVFNLQVMGDAHGSTWNLPATRAESSAWKVLPWPPFKWLQACWLEIMYRKVFGN